MSSPYSFYGQKGAMNDYFSLTEMFFFIVFLLYLSENNAQDEEIVDCATGAPPRRPSIPPEFFGDRNTGDSPTSPGFLDGISATGGR